MASVLQQFNNVRAYSEGLCKPLQIEDYTPQSSVFASPPKWHLAHTTWFFEEMLLKPNLEGYIEFDSDFGFLFNSYYNSLGQRIERQNRGLITRPGIEVIFEYRKYVNEAMIKLLSNSDDKTIIDLTILGISHEQQHQELLLTDLKYTFSCNPIYPKYTEHNLVETYNSKESWRSIKEGIYTIGHSNHDFCFDNELGSHRVFIESFDISEALVTNGEFLEFIKAGGYNFPKYWLDDGWQWIEHHQIKQPLYWTKQNDEWYHFTLSGLKKIDPNAILSHVSYYEASAYAFWKGMRLPTEFEWEVASRHLDWGKRWEWTNSAYLPYPNFKVAKGAIGEYNGKFMVNTMVLRGASTATSFNHSRTTYRNFFSPETQWQFSGIRLVKNK